jgi:hypothetical protein
MGSNRQYKDSVFSLLFSGPAVRPKGGGMDAAVTRVLDESIRHGGRIDS